MMKVISVSMVVAGWLVAGNAMAEVSGIEMPALARKNNCTACHAVYKRLVGPGWLDVSKKYKGVSKYTYGDKQYPLVEGLMLKVSKGGSGSWGAMPMPANDAAGAKQADIKELVTFILGLEKVEEEKLSGKNVDAKKPDTKKTDTKKPELKK